ncbi:hypothetical protein OG21DRAFT_1516407 [Imleria badia]|nr:hypothetical protein OG21DRAFT_1516407 [Imleria badia]
MSAASDESDLLALARTCRSFKEPALDVLWGELLVPSAVARCLPEASHHSQTNSFFEDDKVRRFRVFIKFYFV